MLGQEDVQSLFEEQDGEISVDCQFCGKHYVVGAHHLEKLFSPEEAESARTSHPGSSSQH